MPGSKAIKYSLGVPLEYPAWVNVCTTVRTYVSTGILQGKEVPQQEVKEETL